MNAIKDVSQKNNGELMTDLDMLANEINTEHALVKEHCESMLLHAKICGDHLIAAKKQCPHGKWGGWLDEHCDFSRQTSNSYA